MYNLETLESPYASEDLEAIRAINQENIPEVSDIESIERLIQLIEWNTRLFNISKQPRNITIDKQTRLFYKYHLHCHLTLK